MNNLIVSSSPHFKSTNSTAKIMRDVIIALIPAGVASVYYFGPSALALTAVCVLTCMATEFVYNRIMNKPNTIGDLSAVVTGILLAYNLPANLALWKAAVGSIFAIAVVKCLFGGLGQNFVNPAIGGRIFLALSFTAAMSSYPNPFYYQGWPGATTGATILGTIKEMFLKNTWVKLPTVWDFFIGNQNGMLGETCAAALILGGIYLMIRKVISPIIPCTFIGTVFVLTWLLDIYPVYQIFSGGLMLGAIFMATDYVTSPMSDRGKIVFGIGCGVLTVVMRLWSSSAEGVSYAILLMNILTPTIDQFMSNKPFGGVRKR